MARLLPLCLLALGVLAAPAQGATVKVDPGAQRLTYEAASGEANVLVVTQNGQSFKFVDTGTALSSQATARSSSGTNFTCVRPVSTTVICTVTGQWDLRVRLGDLNDTATLATSVPAEVEGGVGNDIVLGGAGADEIEGDEGNDVLDGGAGADEIDGNAGDDTITARDGIRDEIGCDGGVDAVTADAEDLVGSECETVARPIVPPSVPEPPPTKGDGTPNPPVVPAPVHPARPEQAAGPRAATPVATPPLTDDTLAPVADAQPEAGKSVAAGVKRGNVLVRTGGGGEFEPLAGGTAVPVGATVDARAGVVTLTSASNLEGATQTAEFTGAVFKVAQRKGKRMTTVLTLAGDLDCATPGKARAAGAKKKPKSRRLWGSGHGRFTTRGRNSQATVRGTIWSVEDRCDATVTRVERGLVAVDDFATGKSALVRAGGKHVARKRTKSVR